MCIHMYIAYPFMDSKRFHSWAEWRAPSSTWLPWAWARCVATSPGSSTAMHGRFSGDEQVGTDEMILQIEFLLKS